MKAALTEDLDEDVVVDDLDTDVAVQGCSNQATYEPCNQYIVFPTESMANIPIMESKLPAVCGPYGRIL